MPTLSQAIMQRAAMANGGSSCEMCGASIDLQPYHKDGNSKNYSPENIGVLCTNCYMDRERFLKALLRPEHRISR